MSSPNTNSMDYHDAIKSVVEHLKSKRGELLCEINKDEVEKAQVLGEMDKLKDKLSIIEANLKKKSEFRKDYDKAIIQSEGHFVELMQKSEDFLMQARREALALSHAVGDKPENTKENYSRRMDNCLKIQGQSSERKAEEICAPVAVIAVQPAESANCVGCTSYGCTTIAVPYRANGL